MASPGNQHCANCIGTLSFPIIIWWPDGLCCFYELSRVSLQAWHWIVKCLRSCITMFVCDSACVAQTTASLLSTHATLLSPQSPPHPHCLCAENATDIATVAHLVQWNSEKPEKWTRRLTHRNTSAFRSEPTTSVNETAPWPRAVAPPTL